MADLEHLKAKIERLSSLDQSASAQGRLLETSSDVPPLFALLREIEETQRPRKLEFRNNRTEVVTISAKSGRIRSLVSPNSSDVSENVKKLSEALLSEGNAAVTNAVLEVLSKFAQDAQRIVVMSTPLEMDRIGAARGLCPQSLLRLHSGSNPLRGSDIAVAMDQFMKSCLELALAYVRLEDTEIVANHGSKAKVDQLWQLAGSQIKAASGTNTTDPKCLILSGEDPQSPAVICVTAQSTRIYAVAESENTAAILASWYSALGSNRNPAP